VPGLWRWFILLLVLAFAASGLLPVSGAGHAAGVALHAHDLASVTDGSSGGEGKERIGADLLREIMVA
jgi:hypothetical protein